MKSVITIIKKEFARFFKDRRMVLSIILPGILIYAMYSIIGTVTSKMTEEDADYVPTAYCIDMPEDLEACLTPQYIKVSDEKLTEEQAMQKVQDGELDVVVKYVAAPAEVQIFYNSSENHSTIGYNLVRIFLSAAQQPKFTINASLLVNFDLAEERDTAGRILSMLIPMLMFSMLASAGMSVAPESIAGEKERGTMATMLITPIKRWQLALGKIISLSCFAMLSGISSFLGIILSLPKLTAGMLGANTAALYSVGDYFMIFGVIISVVLLIISAFSVISCMAKSVKESSSLIAPLMIIIILLGMVTMFVSSTPAVGLFLIPMLGSGLAISGIMAFTATPLAVFLSILSNLIVTALLVVLLAFMFKSEKIMFKR